MPDLTKLAIQAALDKNWKKAIEINQQLIKIKNEDIDSISRLAYAYSKLGEIEKAKKLYQKALKIDKYNYIIKKNLERLNCGQQNNYKSVDNESSREIGINPELLIDEAGKTKTVKLKNCAPLKILQNLGVGDTVYLKAKSRIIEVRTCTDCYLGVLPDDLSFKMMPLIKKGNKYNAFIQNLYNLTVTVFIREIFKSKKLKNQPSFSE